MMVVKHLKGRITEDGELQLNEPEELHDLKPGEVEVTVVSTQVVQPQSSEDVIWTEEELKKALTFHPVPANQMKTGGWEDVGIEDSEKWVEELRRKEELKRQWPPRS